MKHNIGFIRKVHQGILKLGRKYKYSIPLDQYTNTKLRHFNRKFIRDYIHSFPFDRELQCFITSNSEHYDLAPFSYFNYTTSPTVKQLQWLAGFTEHFCSFKIQYTPKISVKGIRYHPIIRLFYVGTCYPLFKYIANWYNGKIIQYESGHWGFCLSNVKAIQLLSDILPYCIIKKDYFLKIIEFIHLYKLDTQQFKELYSFELYSENMKQVQKNIFPLESEEMLHYLGGFYDAKGNVECYYGKKFITKFHLYSQCIPLLELFKDTILKYCAMPHLQIHYSLRDNVSKLYTDKYKDVMQFLPFIQRYSVYKRVYAELMETWLPIFQSEVSPRGHHLTPSGNVPSVLKYAHIHNAIRMYWLFLQYGIELDKSESVWV